MYSYLPMTHTFSEPYTMKTKLQEDLDAIHRTNDSLWNVTQTNVNIYMYTPWNVCAVRDLLGGASFVSLAGQHTFCWQNCDNQAVTCKHRCLYISYMAHIGWIYFCYWKNMSIYEYIFFTMFVVKLRTPSRANYEHFHVYLAYRRQTGTVVTRQTYDRAPRITRSPTAHISRGDVSTRQEKHHTYLLGPEQHPVQHSSQEKDIGVTFDEQLTFEHHLNEKINKSNSIVGIIRRTFEYLDQSNFVHLYRYLVRPRLEYANQIWAPHLKKHITAIENVQRRATKLAPSLKHLHTRTVYVPWIYQHSHTNANVAKWSSSLKS